MANVKEATKPQLASGHRVATDLQSQASTAVDGRRQAFVRRFADELDRLYEDFGLRLPGLLGRGRQLLLREAGFIPGEWSPRVEVRERDGRYLIRADLPGLSKDDVQVEVTDELLTIRGERKQETEEHHEGSFYNECSYGGFYRAIPLPVGVDTSKATAEFHNGVLEIAMPVPRSSEKNTHRLEIHEKK